MDTSFSPNENYPFLSQFLLPEDYENQQDYLDSLIRELDASWQRNKINFEQTNEYLTVRENIFGEVILKYYKEQYSKLVEESLHTKNSFEILFKNTSLLDSIIHSAFEFAFSDLSILKKKVNEDLKKEYKYAKKSLQGKNKKLDHTLEEIDEEAVSSREKSEMRRRTDGKVSSEKVVQAGVVQADVVQAASTSEKSESLNKKRQISVLCFSILVIFAVAALFVVGSPDTWRRLLRAVSVSADIRTVLGAGTGD